jgi:alkylation response protein AidB-like acyl-CoA dehydrogenase
MSIEAFREEVRSFVEENCAPSLRNLSFHWEDAHEIYNNDAARHWRDAMASRGWTAPAWPSEYGGGGLNRQEHGVLAQEIARIKAIPPLTGMGLTMIGPTLLEFGTEEQKQRHIPKMISGEVNWCQGYSEPGAGSDLAGLQTRAVLEGDHFVINGQKIWTSGAQFADWMFALVRTDPDVPKHDGISFVLLDMHQPGVTIKPIQMISGSSPFCETFFDDAVALREDLVGELNKGWTVGKRLLQFERSGVGAVSSSSDDKKKEKSRNDLAETAKQYYGESESRIADSAAREKVIRHTMAQKAFSLTTERVIQENLSGKTPGAATSIFKLVGSTLMKQGNELKSELMGVQGTGWEGNGFSESELEATRSWLTTRAVTIYGGTNEVQMNIISKRVLGLPD